MPEVSIVVPLYNKAGYVERCVASIRSQTFADFEVIVVDDGSTDTSFADFERACVGDARFRLVRQPNGGVSKARNAGIEHARADIIAFLDADDEWSPGYLAAIAALARRHPDAPLLGTAYQIVQGGTDVHLRQGLFDGVSPVDVHGFFAAWSRLGGCPLFIGATAARRADLLAIGGFELGMNLGEELLAFIRLAERGPLAFDDRPLAIYHLGLAGTLATSPSPAAIRNHLKLVVELERQVALGRCPQGVHRRWLGLHAGYLMQAGQRAELFRLLVQSPAQFRARQWMAALLEVAGMRGALRRLMGRA
ncbi:MAG: glycosyltransferase [Burkholderiaceae bacterium]|jgi:glycosyltransferase involved in cell wall biosynthesis|nr:glycosyltransferase family 2 protein [Burkholderiales bacterium]MCZ8106419.1 glycosyltransferase [Burkholderiales bacterium]MCZ8336901.1 glycosyltransferase [Burkholderiaceae bacterium]